MRLLRQACEEDGLLGQGILNSSRKQSAGCNGQAGLQFAAGQAMDRNCLSAEEMMLFYLKIVFWKRLDYNV